MQDRDPGFRAKYTQCCIEVKDELLCVVVPDHHTPGVPPVMFLHLLLGAVYEGVVAAGYWL
jgi:hypothetical protein